MRVAAALIIALLLPVQGFAAACAQICARTQQAAHAAMLASAGDNEAGAADHCGKTDTGAGKCCKAHAFMIDLPSAAAAATSVFHEHACFVARWTNFIPEAPSPPPIVS